MLRKKEGSEAMKCEIEKLKLMNYELAVIL
jgi:hypothetical protein